VRSARTAHPMDRASDTPLTTPRPLPLRLYFFASFAALGVCSPFFPRWLVARGIEGISMGAIAATMPAMGVLGPPVVGFLADSLGLRGSLLRVACLGSLFAFALLAAAGLAHHPLAFGEITALVLVFAVFRAPMLMMADVVAVEGERDGGAPYGETRLWGSFGFLVASVFGGRYLDPESPTALPAWVAVSLLVALATTWAIPVRSGARLPSFGAEIRALLAAADFPLLLAAVFVAEAAISSHELCFSLYLGDLGASSAFIGLSWGLGVLVEIVVMAAAAPLIARAGAPSLVVLALSGVAVRCVLLASLRSLPALMAVQLLHAPAVALLWISALAHLRQRTSPHTFATAQGLFSATVAAGAVVGMLTWGGLYRRLGGGPTFGAAAVVAALAALLALRWAARVQPP
jgi:MFS transporter, PPP family, 3-phenylpropionic acid transporter